MTSNGVQNPVQSQNKKNQISVYRIHGDWPYLESGALKEPPNESRSGRFHTTLLYDKTNKVECAWSSGEKDRERMAGGMEWGGVATHTHTTDVEKKKEEEEEEEERKGCPRKRNYI